MITNENKADIIKTRTKLIMKLLLDIFKIINKGEMLNENSK